MDNSTASISLGGNEYRVGKMTGLKQLHVVRRLSPLLAQLAPLIKSVKASADAQGGGVGAALLNMPMDNLTSIAEGLARLPDADVNYIIGSCLSVTSRRMIGDTGWAKVWNESADMPMFADIELPAMLQLTLTVIFHNLQGFMAAASMLGSQGAATVQPQA